MPKLKSIQIDSNTVSQSVTSINAALLHGLRFFSLPWTQQLRLRWDL
jgi:hypothetical protein